MIWDKILEGVLGIADKFIPDPAQRDAFKLEVLRLEQDRELKPLLAQLAINEKEAQNPDRFVSGWRPSIGWVCSAGLAYTFLLQPLLSWAAGLYGHPAPPSLDMGDLLTLLGGMLGLGGLRTAEKIKGVA